MSQTYNSTIQSLSVELSELQQELLLRDQLVQQLSSEIFRLLKDNNNLFPQPEVSDSHQAEVQKLQEQLESCEKQAAFYQEQITCKDTEIYQLRQIIQELTDRTRMLEQVVQELPQVYRNKFEERIVPVQEQVAALQKENRQLQAELQSVSYRLALKLRTSRHHAIDLPNFACPTPPESDAPSMPPDS